MQQKSEFFRSVIDSLGAVKRELGMGLLEAPYRNALLLELISRGFTVKQEVAYTVFYHGMSVGEYRADLVVNNRVIIEVKAVSELEPFMVAQVINYLRISGLKEGLLVNFGGNNGLKWRYLHNPEIPP